MGFQDVLAGKCAKEWGKSFGGVSPDSAILYGSIRSIICNVLCMSDYGSEWGICIGLG